MTKRYEVTFGRDYDERVPDDGVRVQVDRLWPQRMSKQKAHLDGWCATVAPSTALRTWYRHDAERFAEFSDRYRYEPERQKLTHRCGG